MNSESHTFTLGNLVENTTIEKENISVDYNLYKYNSLLNKKSIYSVEIITHNNGSDERSFAFDFTRLEKNAYRIYSLLVNNFVTSCTLFEILEDIL